MKDTDVRGLSEKVLSKEEAARREELRERAVTEQELGEDELYLEEEGVYHRVQGESKNKLSWIWWDQWELKSDSDDLDYVNAVRVEYCKAKARMDRWREEVMLLKEELRRMIDYALWKSEWWLERRSGKDDIIYEGLVLNESAVTADLVEGINAFSLQQARFQLERTKDLEVSWLPLMEHAEKVLRRAPDIGILSYELKDTERDIEVARRAEENV
ncbi:hypothetical protein VKT23_019222 [Stygiomarasmius scandens]|uniref:Uncharacterized protein n=1 Tax=Marasmiellus scandens TaxID=2682957 RepID=A0ABR1ILY9_9AGAR